MIKESPAGRRKAVDSRFRAEVTGSLLRPRYLLEAFDARWKGGITASELKAIEDRAVDDAVALQEGAGLDLITDGEMRRPMIFMSHLVDGISGVGDMPGPSIVLHNRRGETAEFRSPMSVMQRILRRRMITVEEFAYVRARASHDTTIKVTVPSPFLMYGLWSEASSAVYPDPFELFTDAAALVREEIQELAALGCEYIQVDAPDLLQLYCGDDTLPRLMDSIGLPVQQIVREAPGVINSMVADIPGVKFALHMCRANFGDKWIADGSYAEAAETLFPRMTGFSTFLLEWDDERAGDFRPLAALPKDSTAVLGLVSTKSGRVEDASEIRRRLDDAAKVKPIEELALSTQCGFGTVAAMPQVDSVTQEKKLRLVADVAREVWS